jgi:hypothetical protein
MKAQDLIDLLNKIDNKDKEVQLQIRLLSGENMDLIVSDIKAVNEYHSRVALYGDIEE